MTAKRSTTRKSKDAPTGGSPEKPTNGQRFIEIVNWRAAQPKMTGDNNPWMKLYTSLLDNDGFEALDDAARMLLIGIWLYAARSGRHVFPADPRWLWKKIPMLNSKPDLQPLLEAKDTFGQARPFVRYCEPAVATATRANTPAQQDTAQNSQGRIADESRGEERREEKREERADETLRVSEKKRERKKRVSSRTSAHSANRPAEQRETEQSPAQQTTAAQTTEHQTAAQQTPANEGTAQPGEKPENPKESEAAGSKGPSASQTDQPQTRRSVFHHDPHLLGKIPIWWSDPVCVAFSYGIFQELGLRMDPDSQVGKAERGTFAAWLFQVRASVPMSRWPWLEEKAVAKAREIARYGKAARSPGAVWLKVMASEIEARAGPASAAV